MPIVVEDRELLDKIMDDFMSSPTHRFSDFKHLIVGRFFDFLSVKKSIVDMYLNVLDPTFDTNSSNKKEIEYLSKIIGKINESTSFFELYTSICELINNDKFNDAIDLQNAFNDYSKLHRTMTPKSGRLTSAIMDTNLKINDTYNGTVVSDYVDVVEVDTTVNPSNTQEFYRGINSIIIKLMNALEVKWRELLLEESDSLLYYCLRTTSIRDNSISLSDFKVSLEDLKVMCEKIMKKYYPNDINYKRM